MLIIFIFVLALSMFCAKWMGNYQKAQSAGGSAEVIETIRIAQGKWVQIIRIGSKYKVIAISRDSVTYLGDVDESDIKIADPGEKKSFSEILSKAFADKDDLSGGKQE
ncbi:MAG: flagellar biosynthetic protein FliO [Lachnospiraceae bacterium]|nr:flagellar biosynthetic protein FliO [Lachnospiraceae bacterium]